MPPQAFYRGDDSGKQFDLKVKEVKS